MVAGQTVDLTVATSGTPTPSVQWLVSTDGGKTFSTIAGATSDTYSFTATTAGSGNEYEAVVTSPGSTVTTPPATIDVFSIVTTALPAATRGHAYSFQLEAQGGTSPYTWTRRGALPKGLALSPRGVLSGTPRLTHARPGPYTVTVSATTHKAKGTTGLTASQTLTLTLL